jgi:hypothetical protein
MQHGHMAPTGGVAKSRRGITGTRGMNESPSALYPVDAKMNRRILPAAIAEYVWLIRINGSRYSLYENRRSTLSLGLAN